MKSDSLCSSKILMFNVESEDELREIDRVAGEDEDKGSALH